MPPVRRRPAPLRRQDDARRATSPPPTSRDPLTPRARPPTPALPAGSLPRRCSELIPKGVPRVGVPIKWRGGEYGWISSWTHPACLRVPDVADEAQLAREIHGLETLSKADRELVLGELTSAEPVDLDDVDPNDPAHAEPEGPIARLPAPAALSRPLLSFQEEGLGWMVAAEAGAVRGGILADEMGMGKTIQTISLMLHQKAERAKRLAKRAADRGEARSRAERTAPTLVVVPTSALAQWEDEIRDCTAAGALRVLVYYADRKSIAKAHIEAVDVVLTTYPVVEGEWRKIVNRALVSCEYCGKKMLPRSMITHKKYFCGPDAVRTAKLAKREKKRDVANEKAMRTLRIKKGKAEDVEEDAGRSKAKDGVKAEAGAAPNPGAVPTPANFYRELMTKAGRPAMSMYEAAHRARACPNPGDRSGEVSESDSDVRIVGETPGKSAAGRDGTRAESDADDEMLRVALEVSLRESAESDARKAATNTSTKTGEDGRRTRSARGRAERRTKETPVGKEKGKRKRKGKRRDDDDDDDDDDDEEWTPGAAEKAQEEQDAQIARAVALADASSDDVDLALALADGADASPRSPLPPSEEEMDFSDSLLHSIEWDRVVLDEAHKIKARTTNTAKCIYALRSEKKWCLTGTPLQNRVGELYSLVRFLRMDPHAYYFCKVKGCDCKSLCWNFGPEQRACSACGHAGPRHYSHFNQTVINPINRYGYVGDGKKGFLTLRNEILRPAQLRRTKAERASDVKLPPLRIDVQETEMDEVERDFYESLYMLTRAKFDGYVKKGSVLHNYAHIFELLSRLRQACDHPYLVLHSKSASAANEKKERREAEGSEEPEPDSGATPSRAEKGKRRRGDVASPAAMSDDVSLASRASPSAGEPRYYCGMCQDEVDADDAALAGCKHVFHRECITQYAACAPAKGEKVTCPACRAPLTIDLQPSDLSAAAAKAKEGGRADVAREKLLSRDREALESTLARKRNSRSILSRVDLGAYTSSTKVEALVDGLRSMRAEKDGHLNKAIVFSQYTSMIEIVEWRLKKEGFVLAKLLGSMPVTQRAANLRAFREDPAVGVILMSLKSGGEGLNLQTANRVFVLEPWWNPAVEMQAVMRAHRIGQTRAVTATRFSTKDTIEERMMQLQEKKRLVFEGCMDGNQAALAQLTEEDLQFLFKR